MESFLFQWDKACDAMPLLRPAWKTFIAVTLLSLIFVIFPNIFIPDNEHRPPPGQGLVYDSVKKEYVKWGETVHSYDSANRIEPSEIAQLAQRPASRAVSQDAAQDDIVKATLPPGIGNVSEDLLDDDMWDYNVEVAFIVDSAFGRKRLKTNTGMFVDSRDLLEVSRHSQQIDLDPPSNNRAPVKNYNVIVKTLRSRVTHCTYYSMFVFGAERLVLGGNGSAMGGSC